VRETGRGGSLSWPNAHSLSGRNGGRPRLRGLRQAHVRLGSGPAEREVDSRQTQQMKGAALESCNAHAKQSPRNEDVQRQPSDSGCCETCCGSVWLRITCPAAAGVSHRQGEPNLHAAQPNHHHRHQNAAAHRHHAAKGPLRPRSRHLHLRPGSPASPSSPSQPPPCRADRPA